MNILEQIYEINFNKINFLERKISITEPNTILLGPPKSGKTYLIYDYLGQFDDEEYIYIDLDDCKNDKDEIVKYLGDFINEHHIKVLVLENYEFDFDLPKVTSTIITTDKKQTLEGFSKLYIYPLDFEEFLLFDTKHQNTSYSFNSFLKFGNFPEILEYSEQKKTKRNYEICQLYSKDNTILQILFLLIKSAGEKKSIYQLFTQLKKSMKISKDKFYKTCEELEDNKVIYFIPKYEHEKAVKKLYVFNHALIDMVSYKKNFNNLFKNMVFLELNRRYTDIYYLDNINFYIPDSSTAVIAIPFFNTMLSSVVLKKVVSESIKYDIEDITIVTVSSEDNIEMEDKKINVITFSDWVLSL